MNRFLQLLQWPPTTSTVIGLGLLVGVLDYALTGSMVQAVALAGAFKEVCPEGAGAADQVTKSLNAIMSAVGVRRP